MARGADGLHEVNMKNPPDWQADGFGKMKMSYIYRKQETQSSGGVAENGFRWRPPTPEEIALVCGEIYTDPNTLEQFQVSPLPPDDDGPVAIKKLVADYPSMRKVEIENLLRSTETMNLISASKIGKTHFAISLAIAKAVGRMWLQTFSLTQGRVLYVDCELHPNTLGRRFTAIAAAMGVTMGELEGQIDILSLRGKLLDIIQLGPTFQRLAKGYYSLIILDAMYRLIPQGIDENSNADLTTIYNQIDRYAEMTGAAFVIVHHSSKGVQAGKAVTDVGSGAGAMSRACDTHVILRPHEVGGVIVLEVAARSFPPLESICLRQEYPLWSPAPDLDPTKLKTDRKRRSMKEDIQAASEPPPEPWTPERFAAEFVRDEPRDKQTIIARAATAGLSGRQSDQFIRILLEDSAIHRWSYAGNRAVYLATAEQPISETGARNE